MKSIRILLLCNARPSRAWKFYRRVVDSPGLQICGISQRAVSELDPAQQALATGNPDIRPKRDLLAKARILVRKLGQTCIDRALWCVHGFRFLSRPRPSSNAADLAENCQKAGIATLMLEETKSRALREFVSSQSPDILVILGKPSPSDENVCAHLRTIWTSVEPADGDAAGHTNGLCIRLYFSTGDRQPARTIAALNLPLQARDSKIGLALKTDLLIDDLLLQAVSSLQAGFESRLEFVMSEWMRSILSPYLGQLETARVEPHHVAPPQQRLRSAPSLFFQTLLLCSPIVVVRNWVRALRGKYPVLILAHHLVSDRGHRMGISTEAFWRQVRFLSRHYRIVSLFQATQLLRTGHVESPTVALTFDDGYADNFVSLRAVADEFGIPVSLFITTQPVHLHMEFQHDVIKGDYGAFAMTWDQVRFWTALGAEFGSHTRTHIRCGAVDEAVLVDEIVGSKEDLERQLGSAPEFFAFPYGDLGNMPPRAIEIAAATYPYILSSYGGENFPHTLGGSSHLFRKKAYAEPWELELELQSVFDYVERVKGMLGTQPAEKSVSSPRGQGSAIATAKTAPDIHLERPASQLSSPSAIRQLAKPQ